jgi:hypothetical protein
MRFLLAVALIVTGILGVVFISQGTFAANWPLALIPLAAWLALYIVLRLIFFVIGIVIVLAAVSKTHRQHPGESLNDSAERVRNRAQKAASPRDLFHD